MERLAPFSPHEEDIAECLKTFELWCTVTKRLEDQHATCCRLTIEKAMDYADVETRLHAEFGLRNRWTEAITRLACVTQGANNLWELGRKICTLVDVTLEGAGGRHEGTTGNPDLPACHPHHPE